jgi:cob(I)alamin adenosyltransferase
MSIATRTGDDGTTALMYGRRLPKHDLRVETYGTVDELNAALGLARAHAGAGPIGDLLLSIQKQLVTLMGTLAVAPQDAARYAADKYPKLEPAMLAGLDAEVARLEAGKIVFDGWATPGATVGAATLDVARTVCRRAERLVARLHAQDPVDSLVIHYLNRLSDLLWLLARAAETQAGAGAASGEGGFAAA